MNTEFLSSYSRSDLVGTLKVLKNYKSFLAQAWDRAILTNSDGTFIPVIRVEYPIGFDESSVKSFIDAALPVYFPEISTKEVSLHYTPASHILGWVRIFCADDMVDISFQKFSSVFSK